MNETVMGEKVNIRLGRTADIDQLLEIEQVCFDTDRLSRRSFLRFIKPGAHELLIVEDDHRILGYVLMLFKAGTNLARLYSIAVVPDAQGRGLSKVLLVEAEKAALLHRCAYLRLEVNINNMPALSLYRHAGFQTIGTIKLYYDNGDDALRMEKRLRYQDDGKTRTRPYYQQTTDFSCGPASLMMAMKTLRPEYSMSRQEELQIWREATTIYMTSGHGGCSPHGLALSAWHRGYSVTLYINQEETPFIDGVRDEHKKDVIEFVHNEFLRQIEETSIKINVCNLEAEELDHILHLGKPIIALISTWRLNRNKAPHWVFVADSDEDYVYVNDSDIGDDPHVTQTDYIQVPIDRHMFREMARFGQKRLRCLLVLGGVRD